MKADHTTPTTIDEYIAGLAGGPIGSGEDKGDNQEGGT